MDSKHLSVVVFKDSGCYIAQAIEVDIAAQGRTPEEALNRLGVAVNVERREAEEAGRDMFDIGPAPEIPALSIDANPLIC